MKRLVVFAATAMIGSVAVAETLVNFTTPGIDYNVAAGRYRTEFASEQVSVSADGLVVRTDSSKEDGHSGWLTLPVPTKLGAKDDWFGRRLYLVLANKPTGRMKSNIALNFTDAGGETFQYGMQGEEYNDLGELVLKFDLNGARGKGWGGKNNNVIDRPLHFTAVNIHYAENPDQTKAFLGETSLLRIDDIPLGDLEREYPRTTVSVEPISTNTMFPGAEPFPGAKRLAFLFEPAFNGKATLTLTHGSVGTATDGKAQYFTTTVSNGIARFVTDLPYSTQYEFISMNYSPADGTKGPFKILRARGEFHQSAAEAMRISAETGNPLHIVRDGKNETPHIIVTNPTETDIAWDTEFVLSDYFGREVKIPFKWTVLAKAAVRVNIPMPLPSKGLWKVRAVVSADDGSKALKETRFAYLDLHEVTPKVEKPKFRFGIHYHGTKYWPDKVDLTIAALVASGAKLTRCDYDHMWSSIEGPQGSFHWEKSDTMIEKMKQAGLALDIIMASFPGWAAVPGAEAKMAANRKLGMRVRNCCLYPREGLFRDFCKLYAERYGTKIDYYEIGNEWDLTATDAVDKNELLRIQREAYEGLHAGCNDVCVIPNGWTTAITPPGANLKVWCNGLVELFAEHPEYYDAWALHCHGDIGSFGVSIDDRFLPLRESTPLKKRPWLLNECAQTSSNNREEYTARHVWMKILHGWSRGSTDHIWYNLRATGWFDGGEPGYGLITADYRPRSGYAAFSAITTIFQGLDFDRIVFSDKPIQVLQFRGKSTAADGLVIAGWDLRDRKAIRAAKFRTDAKSAKLSDLMGNLKDASIVDGVVTFPVAYDPQALILEGATKAELLNRETLAAKAADGIAIGGDNKGKVPTFQLVGPECVKNLYEANPAMVHRLWKSNADLSAKVWLTPSKDGVDFRVVATDDIHTDGDALEFIVTDGKETKTYRFKSTRREGAVDFYTGTLPVKSANFKLNVRLLEDDGEGADGWIAVRGEGEDPIEVNVTDRK